LRLHGGPTLLAVGDLAPTRPLMPATAEVWNYIRSADLATANLEIPLTRHDAPVDKAIALRADPGVAPSLKEAGIDLVTVANNHGAEGLLGRIAEHSARLGTELEVSDGVARL
jgi:hypothetical protein